METPSRPAPLARWAVLKSQFSGQTGKGSKCRKVRPRVSSSCPHPSIVSFTADSLLPPTCAHTFKLQIPPMWNQAIDVSSVQLYAINIRIRMQVSASLLQLTCKFRTRLRNIIDYITVNNHAGLTAIDGSLWICGAGGAIATSSDGTHWTVRKPHEDAGPLLLGIGFTSAKVGYAYGVAGAVVTTEDGGTTWTDHSVKTGTILAAAFSAPYFGIVRTWRYASGLCQTMPFSI